MQPFSLTARWVFPVAGPPLRDGVVTICGDRIEAVEPAGARRADRDLGNVAILPGLVNAHTHLDLTGLRGKCPPTPDFTDWLRGVIRHRRSQTPEQVQGDIREGVAECLKFGTTLVGDIAAGGLSWQMLTRTSLRGVMFWELLGLPKTRARQAWWDMLKQSQSFSATDDCRLGLSPHAPFSVNASIIRASTWTGRNVAIHLAETLFEAQLLQTKSGPFVRFLRELEVWDPAGLAPSFEWILRQTRRARAGPVLLIHCNYLRPDTAIAPKSTIVYCPRTHAAFGHPPHPFREFLNRGVRVAIGTDSLASNPDLDVLAEIRFVHGKHADVPGEPLVRMATLSGAEALGWADETGSLQAGKSADLVVLPLPNEEAADPHRLVLESDLALSGVMFRGRWVREP